MIRLLAAAALLFLSAAHAQTVVSPATSQAFGAGAVHAVAVQADGKVIIGGSFQHVGGVARNNIARLNTDGSVDLTWNPDSDSTVNALALDGGGNVYAGGFFSSIGGQSRNSLAKLSTSGTGQADATWNPNTAGFTIVNAVVLDGSGNVYVAGFFSGVIGGQSRNNIAKLSTSGTGAADATWDPSAVGTVEAMALDGSNLYVAGSFSSIGGQSRNRIAKLSTGGAGAADATWNPNADATVSSVASDGSGNLYAGGTFTTIGGQARNRIAKLSTSGTGAADPTWNPDSSGSVTALALDGGGNLYAGGSFTAIGALTRSRIARLSTGGAGAADPTWNPDANGTVRTIALDGGGKAHAGGLFQAVGGLTRGGFATLSTTSGAADPASPLVLDSAGEVRAIIRDGSGGTIIAGTFTAVGTTSTARLNIARLGIDGSVDATWNPAVADTIWSLALDVSGDIYVGGEFTSAGGLGRNGVARISAVGVVDATWNPNANGDVRGLALDGSGGVFVGGLFTSIGGLARNGIAKLSASGAGAADPTWNPNADTFVLSLALDGSGNLYVGGGFNNIGGQARSKIARLSTSGTGAADATWSPNANNSVFALAPDGAGSVYAGGAFTSIGGQSRNYVAKLSTSGTGLADATWNPNPSDSVGALALDGGGNIHAGGNFTNIGGLTRNFMAKLSPSGTGAADPAWNPNTNGSVLALAIEGNAVHAGGVFNQIAGQSRSGYAVLAPQTAPGPPTVGITFPGNAQATVAFTAPASDGGSPVTGYTATCNPGGITASGASSPIVVAGLSNGTTYSCAVSASNVIGTGAPSGSVLITPSATPYAAPFAFIANANSNNVSVIHVATTQTVAMVAVGVSPYAVAVNPYGNFAYVTQNGAGSQVAVINTTTFAVAATIGVGNFPRGIAINPAGTRVYTANYSGNSVSVINTATNTVIATVPGLPTSPEGIAVNSAGTRVYVANNGGCGGCPSHLATINTATNTVTQTVAIGTNANHLALNPAGTRAFVEVNEGLAVVDLTSNTVITTVPISAWAVAVNPAGTRVYVSNSSANTVTVLDAATNAVITTIPVGLGPNGISVDETGSRVYVANISGNNVSVINTATNTVVATVPVGSGPRSYGRFIGGVPPTAPSAPAIGTLSSSNAGVSVAFTPPVDGGSAITGYTATCNPGAVTATGSASPVFVPGLTNGVSYTCTVSATNSVGTSASSGASNSAIPFTSAVTSGRFTALWWNPSEPGWGVNVSHQGNVVFATWFTYDATGKGLWLSVTATETTPNVFTGTVFQSTGPAFNAVPFSPPPVNTSVGSSRFSFTGPDSLDFTYTVNGFTQTKSIVRQLFSSPNPSCFWNAVADPAQATNYQGAWWNPSESGWVINFTHQGDIVFATLFNYDLDGTPMWLVASSMAKTGPSAYSGTLYRATGPAFNAVPWTSITVTAVGSMSVNFSSGTNGTLSYTANGNSITKSISRLVFAGQGTICGNFAAPSAPTINSIAVGNGQATVSFSAPASTGGLPLTTYTVTCNPGGVSATSASSPITVTGLTNGVTYSCSVSASNAFGASSSSATLNGVPSGPSAIAPAIATSASHTLALDSTGKVYAWGSDSYGQLGQGRASIRPAPAQLAGIPAIDHVSLAGHALAVDIYKQVWSWGDNSCGGQLGPRSLATDSKPARVVGAVSMIRAAAGACFSVAVRTDGGVWGWGDVPGYVTPIADTFDSGIRQLSGLSGIVDIVAGHAHALARRGDGTVFAFGENSQGELGLGSTGGEQAATQITTLPPVAALAAARQSSLALTNTGQIYFWGKRANGAIVASPTALPSPGGTVLAIALTDGVPYVVRDDGSVRVFDVGTSAWQPTVFSGAKGIYPSGQYLAFSISTGGQLNANGSNESGQLGLGDTNVHGSIAPVIGFGSTKMMAVSQLFPSVLALKSDGTLWFWGADTVGQAGDGNPTSSSVPLAVTIPATIKVIAAGDRFSVALDTAGNVWGWGDNRSGPFGASVSSRSTPTIIPGVSGVQAIAAGGPGLVLYLLADSTVMMSGTLAPYVSGSIPIAVAGLTGVTAIAAGTSAYAVKSDGLYAWGANGFGELGNGTTAGGATPVKVQGITGTVSRISAGNNRASAVTSDGKVWAWGIGLLGNGTSAGSPTAVNVAGITDAADVSVGQSATLVRRQGGSIYAWGNTGIAGSGASLSPYSIAFHQPVLAVKAGAGHSLGYIVGSGGLAWGFGFYQSVSAQGAAMGDGTYVSRDRPVVLLAPGGGGNLDTNNWYLDLDLASSETLPPATTPGALGIARLFGSEAGVSLQATIKYKTSDFDKPVNNYALALVPAQFFAAVKSAPGTPSMPKLRELEKAGGGFVLAQLLPSGSWGVVQGQFEAYKQSVAGPAGDSHDILDNTPLPQLESGRFCVGYGDSAESMLSTQQLREVLNLQGGTTPQGSSVPCVLIGVYVEGSSPSSTAGTPATFTASVVGVLPEGEIRFTKATEPQRTIEPLQSVPLVRKHDAVATAQLASTGLALGVHYIGATYPGDPRNPAVFADPPLRHVVASTSSIALSGPGKSAKGEKVVFESIVTGSAPAGTVRFKSNGVDLGDVPVRQGKASFGTELLAVAIHNVTANYLGDGSNAASTSNTIVHEVSEAVPTSVSVTASDLIARIGDPVTFTATVTGVSPSGTVTFREGNATLGSASLANGSASIIVSSFTAGTHAISADFTAAGSADRVTSTPVTIAVSLPGEVTFIPGTLAFGSLPLATTSAAQQATLLNTTGGALSVSSVSASAGFAATHNCATLAAGGSCAAMVTFTPGALGTIQGTLTFQTSVGARSVALTGTGIVNSIPTLVTGYYQSILGRAPDPGGQAFWEGEATRMVGLGASVNEAFFGMSLQFFNSAEYQARNTGNSQYLADLYRTFFIREPDSTGQAFWEAVLDAGMDRGTLLTNFLFSPEFKAFMAGIFGTPNVRPEIDMTMDLFRGILGRLPDNGGFNYWLGQLRAAQCQGSAQVKAKVGDIAADFVNSAEYAAREAARPAALRLKMHMGDLYNAFLRRGADSGGYDYWVGEIAAGRRTRDEVRAEFLKSAEFDGRVNQVIAAGCSP